MKTRPSADKRKTASHRLAIVEGHLHKVRSMLSEGAYCIDIIHQSRAIQQALKKFDEQMLRHHLQTCVRRDIRVGRAGTKKTVTELTEIFQRL